MSEKPVHETGDHATPTICWLGGNGRRGNYFRGVLLAFQFRPDRAHDVYFGLCNRGTLLAETGRDLRHRGSWFFPVAQFHHPGYRRPAARR